MKRQVMKRAWEIYRTLEGDRIAKLSYAMKQAWEEICNPEKEMVVNLRYRVYEVRPVAGNGVEIAKVEPAEKIVKSFSNAKGIYRSRYEMIVIDFVRPNFEGLSDKAFVVGETYDVHEGLKKAGFSWNKSSKAWVAVSSCGESDKAFLAERAIKVEVEKMKKQPSKDDADYYSINGGHELGKFSPELLRHRFVR